MKRHPSRLRRVVLPLSGAFAAFLLSACGLLIGIEDSLEVVGEAGVREATSPQPPDAPAEVQADTFVPDVVLPPPKRPAEGTYTYDVDGGGDRIQGFVNFSFGYGPTATISISHIGSDCFDEIVTLRDEYVETLRFCTRGSQLIQLSTKRDQGFALGIAARTTSACDAGDVYFTSDVPPDGKVFVHDCAGKNNDDRSGDSRFRTFGVYTYKGRKTLSIMGKSVSTLWFHDDRSVSGSQTGTNVADWYLAEEDGMPLALLRNIRITYPSPVGMITYTEVVDMALGSRPDAGDAGAD